jgi:hypothetical protein
VNTTYLSTTHNTSKVGPSSVLIIHPYHPLRGHRLEIVDVPRTKGSKIVVRTPEGATVRIPKDWTDLGSLKDNPRKNNASHLLDVAGLHEAAKIITHLKKKASEE